MGKSIYTYYKERLIEIGGNSKCLYLKNISRRGAYDIGRLLEGRDEKIVEFTKFLRSVGKGSISLINEDEKSEIIRNLEPQSHRKHYDDDGEESSKRMEPGCLLPGWQRCHGGTGTDGRIPRWHGRTAGCMCPAKDRNLPV